MRKHISFIFLITLILVSYLFISAQDTSKILKFSHKKHVKDEGMDCTDCHTTIAMSTKANAIATATNNVGPSNHPRGRYGMMPNACGVVGAVMPHRSYPF